MIPLLQMYIDQLLSIKNGSKNGKSSLSKPLYLLSIIYCIEQNKLTSNEIHPDDDSIRSQFKQLYKQYRKEFDYRGDSTYYKPLFHLSTSPFYHLIWRDGVTPPNNNTSPSAKFLRDHLLYAKLDDKLWELLQDAESRELIKRSIIQKYLPHPL